MNGCCCGIGSEDSVSSIFFKKFTKCVSSSWYFFLDLSVCNVSYILAVKVLDCLERVCKELLSFALDLNSLLFTKVGNPANFDAGFSAFLMPLPRTLVSFPSPTSTERCCNDVKLSFGLLSSTNAKVSLVLKLLPLTLTQL
ncbi:hypothetical protein OGAPHI_006212 [Ogataea philodendri]|uniref:Uncharacterized protein n=1 Tax=Ogataea philodendri TaxID=1378263 RepID=A0A9P8T1T8_9ASCO|nr:uncharacterized protein OGAPHI_006212 [Ogataea philodendri]KAH3662031.1 hypothetical protein OGAPHI_006212 [Ogataea philodendri]